MCVQGSVKIQKKNHILQQPKYGIFIILIAAEIHLSTMLTDAHNHILETVRWSPLICVFALLGVSYPQSSAVRKHQMENSRKKQFISSKLCDVLSNVMKSHAIPLHPAREVNHSFVQHIHSVYTTLPLVT